MTKASKQRPESNEDIFDTAHLKHNISARAGRGASVVLIFAAAKFALQLITTAILARLVSPAEHGLVAMALPAIVIATSVSEFGLVEAIIQKEKVTQRIASVLFWTNTFLGLLSASLIALLAWPAAQFYNEARIAPIFLALAPTIFFAALGAQFVAILRRQMRVKETETVAIIAISGANFTAVVMAWTGFSYWAIAAQILLQPIFVLGLLVSKTRWRPSRPSIADLYEASGSLRFGGVLAISRLISLVTQNLGIFLVGRIFGTTETGLYFRAWTLANLPQQRAVSPLSNVFFPALSRITTDANAFTEVVCRAETRIALLTVPAGVLIGTSADAIVHILLGESWSGAASILAWLSILTLQASLNHSLQWSLLAVGAATTILGYRIFGAIAVLVALTLGLQFGIIAMAQAYMFTMVVVMLPVLAVLVVKNTPMTSRQIRRLMVQDVLFALFCIAVVLGVRMLLPIALPFLELAFSCCALLCCVGVRVAISKSLRKESAALFAKIGKR